MTATLSMPNELLAIGRRYLDCGRDQEALNVLEKLGRLADVPADVTAEAQLHLADICVRRRKFLHARRHLNVVLACDPDCAQAHYMLASSLTQEENGNLKRAARHFRKAVELDPSEAMYAADYGLCLLELGRRTAGLKQLRKAVELAPDEIEYCQDLAMKLMECGQPIEARRVALAALFRQPHNTQARKLWNDIRFHEARMDQKRELRVWRVDGPETPAILPFRGVRTKSVEKPIGPRHTFTMPLPKDVISLPLPRRNERRQSL
jgi:Tfp pilus assembly protein PilF